MSEDFKSRAKKAVITNAESKIGGKASIDKRGLKAMGNLIKYLRPTDVSEIPVAVESLIDSLLTNSEISNDSIKSELTTLKSHLLTDVENTIKAYINYKNSFVKEFDLSVTADSVTAEKYQELLAKYNNSEKQLQEFRELIKDVSIEFEKYENAHGNLSAIANKEKELLSTVQTLTETIQQLSVAVVTIKEQKEELDRTVHNLKLDNISLTSKREKLNESLNTVKLEIESLQEQESELKSSVVTLQEELEEIKNTITQSKEQHSEVISNVETLQQTKDSLESTIKALRNELEITEYINTVSTDIATSMSTVNETVAKDIETIITKLDSVNIDVDLTQELVPVTEKLDALTGLVNANKIEDRALLKSSLYNDSLLSNNRQLQKTVDRLNSKVSELTIYTNQLMDLNGIKDVHALKPEIARKMFISLCTSVGITIAVADSIYNRTKGYQQLLEAIAMEVDYEPTKLNTIVEFFANVNGLEGGPLYLPTKDTLKVFSNPEYKEVLEKYNALSVDSVVTGVFRWVIKHDLINKLQIVDMTEEDKMVLAESSKDVTLDVLKTYLDPSFMSLVDSIQSEVGTGDELAFVLRNLFSLAETPLSQLSSSATFILPELQDTIVTHLPTLQSILPTIRWYRSVDDLLNHLNEALHFATEQWTITKFADYASNRLKEGNYRLDLVGVDEESSNLKYNTMNVHLDSGDFSSKLAESVVEFVNMSRASKNNPDGSTNPLTEVKYVTPALFAVKGVIE